jgi:subtilisin-like proprotein convertase family protein
MKTILTLLLMALPLHAASSYSQTFTVSTTIPDNNIIGIADSRSVATSITQIAHVSVSLNITGGWNGDFYAYLSHGSGFAILLNRPGRNPAAPYGSGSSGFSVLLADSADSDIHTAIPNSGLVTGTYQPDARNTDPGNAADSDIRSAFLGSFVGLDPNGQWTLFIADVSPGDTGTLQSWTLQIQAIPEPRTVMLAVFGVVLMLGRRGRCVTGHPESGCRLRRHSL